MWYAYIIFINKYLFKKINKYNYNNLFIKLGYTLSGIEI